MIARRSRAVTAAAIVAAACLPLTAGATGIGPQTITYTEEIAAGPRRFAAGRELPQDANAFGIDVDSRVWIDVDESKLRSSNDGACLEPRERDELKVRLERLTASAAALGKAAASVKDAMSAFEAGDSTTRELRPFFDRAERMGELVEPLIEILGPALAPYLERQGVPAAKLDDEVGELQKELLTPDDSSDYGYNWPLIRRVLYSEIEAVAARLAQLDRSLEIQAHLIHAQGATALALPGYNRVATGPESLYPRLRFGDELTEEKKQAGKAIDAAKEEGAEAKKEISAKEPETIAARAVKIAEVNGAKKKDEAEKAEGEHAKLTRAIKVATEIAETAAGLPLPAGLEPRPLHDNLDTSFVLKTVREVRPQPGDRVEVRSRLFCGEEALAGADRTDSFTVRAFGWTDAAFPIIAFTQLDGTSAWEGDGGFSWLLRRNPWPRAGQADRPPRQLRWWGGLGISALELDFDEEETVEIGFALTTAFIQDRLVAGYGIDLQKDGDREFWFFSIRVFPKFSLLEKAKGGGK